MALPSLSPGQITDALNQFVQLYLPQPASLTDLNAIIRSAWTLITVLLFIGWISMVLKPGVTYKMKSFSISTVIELNPRLLRYGILPLLLSVGGCLLAKVLVILLEVTAPKFFGSAGFSLSLDRAGLMILVEFLLTVSPFLTILGFIFGATLVVVYDSSNYPALHMRGTYIMAAAGLGFFCCVGFRERNLSWQTFALDLLKFVGALVAAFGGKFGKDRCHPEAKSGKGAPRPWILKGFVAAVVMACGQFALLLITTQVTLKLG